MNKVLLFWLAMLLMFSGTASIWFGWQAFGWSREESVDVGAVAKRARTSLADKKASSESWLTEYTLTERSGEPFSSHALDGQVHVVSFFFATCPHYCAFQNRKMAELHMEFSAGGVKFVSITCDPRNDTPEALAKYAKQFDADENWVFLTGELNYLKRIGSEKYGVALQPQWHIERFLVVDRSGKIRDTFHWNDPEQIAEMKELLPKLLAEEG